MYFLIGNLVNFILYHNYLTNAHLRNELLLFFFFWNVHRIINGFTLTLQETRNIHDSMYSPNFEFIAYFYILL